MTFSTSDIQNRIQEIERDYFELAGHVFVRECIDLYLNGELQNIGKYDTEAILFLRDDNIDHMRQMLEAMETNMRVVHTFANSMAHKASKNKTIRLVNYKNNPKYFNRK